MLKSGSLSSTLANTNIDVTNISGSLASTVNNISNLSSSVTNTNILVNNLSGSIYGALIDVANLAISSVASNNAAVSSLSTTVANWLLILQV
jgi:hypothetical protein